MPNKLLDEVITMEYIINKLAHLPELLRECNKDEEAENLDCLIEDIKNVI